MTQENKEKLVCLSFKALYEYCYKNKKICTVFNSVTAAECDYGIIINEDGLEYCDFYKNEDGSLILCCCDGEQCKVLERTDKYVRLVYVEDLDNQKLEDIDESFKLSINEFDIAAFGKYNNKE